MYSSLCALQWSHEQQEVSFMQFKPFLGYMLFVMIQISLMCQKLDLIETNMKISCTGRMTQVIPIIILSTTVIMPVQQNWPDSVVVESHYLYIYPFPIWHTLDIRAYKPAHEPQNCLHNMSLDAERYISGSEPTYSFVRVDFSIYIRPSVRRVSANARLLAS